MEIRRATKAQAKGRVTLMGVFGAGKTYKALLWARVMAGKDGTIVVIDVDRSRRRPVLRLLDALRNVDAHPLGVVLNRTDPASSTRDFAKRAGPGAPDLPRR